MDICKNGYSENFIDKCFKNFLNNIHLVKENVPKVGKKTKKRFTALQTRTKLQEVFKGVLSCWKLENDFKC